MNTAAMCCCWHLAPYAMAPAPSGIVGIAPSRDVILTAWAKLSPSSNPPPSRMQGGTSPRTRFHLNSFNLVGQSPRWSACCPRGARQSPVWGMNAPEGLSTPLWCGQVHCPYGHAPGALWSGFRGVWGVDIHQNPTYGASVTSRKGARER